MRVVLGSARSEAIFLPVCGARQSAKTDPCALCRDATLFGLQGEINVVPDTYKPGEEVPRDGTVQCTRKNGVRDHVKKGTKFAPCQHWGDHDGKGCTWQYV